MRFVPCTYDQHAEAILGILNNVIATSTAIYEYTPRSLASMESWFKKKAGNDFPVIGAEAVDGQLLGFATYGTFREWPAFKYTVEHSVYIHQDHRGQGLGLQLMNGLIAVAREQGRHLLVGAIDTDNAGSIALHLKLGFVHAGTIKQAGFKFGRWLDLAFYQLTLETPAAPYDN